MVGIILRLLPWTLVAYLIYHAIAKASGPPGLKPTPAKKPGTGKIDIVGPCERNPKDRTLVTWLVSEISKRPGATLLQKIPTDVLKEIQDMRARFNAVRVERFFRQTDHDQTPAMWIANQAYWGAYPRGPIVIPDQYHACAGHWKRIHEWVKDDLRTFGLL